MSTTWLADIEKKVYPKLDKDLFADVAIIGAGLSGSLAAYFLAKEGKKVVVIDKADVENSVTAYTTAWITADLDTDISDLMKMYGKEKVKALFDSGNAAVDMYEKVITDEKIDCEFVRSSVFMYASSYKDTRYLDSENAAAQLAGVEVVLDKKTLQGFKNIHALEFPRQAKFHPLKFLNGIQAAAIRYGAEFYNFTEATDIVGNLPVTVMTKEGKKITAAHCITATYQPFNKPKELFAKKGMYKSYVFEVTIPNGIIKEGMYLDCHNPYHYFRIDPMPEHDRMIFGGEDHRKEIPISEEKSFHALEAVLQDLISGKEFGVVKKWTGYVLENVDGLPYIGMYSSQFPNRLVATAFSGNGMHFSMIAGQVFRDIILKRENKDIQLYDASRKITPYRFFKKGLDFVGEFFGGAFKNIFS